MVIPNSKGGGTIGMGRYEFENLPLRQPNGPDSMRPQVDEETSFGLGNMSIFNVEKQNPNGNFDYGPVVHQENPSIVVPSWQAAAVSYTLASTSPHSPHYVDEKGATSSQTGFYIHISNDIGPPWTQMTAQGNYLEGMNDPSAYEIPYGSFGSLDSNPGSTPTSATTSPDGFVFPLTTSFELPQAPTQLCDPDLSDEYFRIGPQFSQLSQPQNDPNSPLYPGGLLFEPDNLQDTYYGMSSEYTTTSAQWAPSSFSTPPQPQSSYVPQNEALLSNTSWTPEQLQVSRFQSNANSGAVAFEPPRGTPYEIFKAGEELIEDQKFINGFVAVSPPTPVTESDEEWVNADPRNYTPSHSSASPCSQKSALSRTSSPHVDHRHVFSSFPGITKPKISRGRQRGLTQLEKRQAREVRDAKACWACHISKTKCSPCSPGSPCEQCARLVGKRRFCKFTCFNDPLESLHTFLVPGYLMGHFNRQEIEAFVTRNAETWGTQSLSIRMNWGYRRLVTAEVVALTLRNDAPDMGEIEHTISNGVGVRPTFVRKDSPPLGIPLAAMDDMQDKYSRYVQDIVQSDLPQYVPVAYFKEDSPLVTRLLSVVCSYYISGLEADVESEVLRRAIEMHVTSVVLEKTLFLDQDSIRKAEEHLYHQYPEKTTSRCAQRQIKLAFFQSQEKRINKVLKDWGNMMWTINNAASSDNKWAVSFCVFLTVTLVIDKIFASAYYYCEGRIQNQGEDAKTERAQFQELVSLTEEKLFDRCKEIFHWKFKTRKGGKEACNPIRDGMDAFRGRATGNGIASLTYGLQAVVRDFTREIRSHRSLHNNQMSPYTDVGRLACIFLDDFLDH
ncbi:hypothetical protein BGZ60DRAFT_523311 [Tricladium varicosporioides]|nr:hypothetical protein BGZ60DRAFT_523311 [Hymenoscyphus varicosporioides]